MKISAANRRSPLLSMVYVCGGRAADGGQAAESPECEEVCYYHALAVHSKNLAILKGNEITKGSISRHGLNWQVGDHIPGQSESPPSERGVFRKPP